MMVAAGLAEAQTANPSSASMQRVAVDRAGPAGFADLAAKVKPAVIGVTSKIAVSGMATQGLGSGAPGQGPSRQRSLPAPKGPAQGRAPIRGEVTTIGSGFFISPDGYAVTNDHVVEHSDKVQVRTNDNKTLTAKVVGRDPLSDLALIKVEGGKNFSYVKLADQPPRVGDWVLTVGSPYGLGGSVTAGIVSARGRSIKTNSAEDFLQIDAPINRGDSGGPSFNTDGKVVGVNSMIFSPSGGSSGIAFAVPADTVKTVIPRLKAKGTVTRGWMGVRIQSITPRHRVQPRAEQCPRRDCCERAKQQSGREGGRGIWRRHHFGGGCPDQRRQAVEQEDLCDGARVFGATWRAPTGQTELGEGDVGPDAEPAGCRAFGPATLIDSSGNLARRVLTGCCGCSTIQSG